MKTTTRIESTRNMLLHAAFGGALLLLLAGAGLMAKVVGDYRGSTRDVEHTYEVITTLDQAQSLLLEAERNQRTYLLTSSVAARAAQAEAASELLRTIEGFQSLVGDNSEQTRRGGLLRTRAADYMVGLDRVAQVLEDEGPEAAAAQVAGDVNRERRTAAHALVEEARAEEAQLLSRRLSSRERSATRLALVMAALGLAALGAGAAAYRTLLRESAARSQAERELKAAVGKLEEANEALRLRTRQSDLLREMAEMFQSCSTDEEGRAVMATFLPRLMPGTSGAVYRHNNSRNVVELVVAWGESPPRELLFSPDECWALRRGKTHSVDQSSAISCEHLGRVTSEAACLPMVAHGETIGVVTVLGGASVGDGAARWSSGIDQVALALANLALRERLSHLSLRDALTGLHNRRFLQDAGAREVLRAERLAHPLTLAVIDIDHFKKFNDAHGHEAGDVALKAVADTLRDSFRGDDVPCRFGGEEFVVLLPGMATAPARERVETLRALLASTRIAWAGGAIGPVTISVGLATMPEHGNSLDDLFRAGDAALYEAKRKGRNRVAVAVPKGTPSSAVA